MIFHLPVEKDALIFRKLENLIFTLVRFEMKWVFRNAKEHCLLPCSLK